jgi:hypothetical protein
MSDLIRRLEEAEEEDGELNVAMWRVIDPQEAASMQRSLEKMGYSGDDLERLMANNCPNYTGDIQDAVSAVPEGWRWLLRQDPNCYRAALNRGPISDLRVMRGEAPTPALALCIAILRAMEAKNE